MTLETEKVFLGDSDEDQTTGVTNFAIYGTKMYSTFAFEEML